MKATGRDSNTPGPGYEATLHLVTHAPVPEDLENRVHAALEAAPRHGVILAWPMAGWATGWMRTAAAAAIVVVVAGGGWGVYRHAQQHHPTKVVVMPAPQVTAPAVGGFSSAGAVRTPQTVKGPAVVETPKPKAAKRHSALEKQRIVKPGAIAEPAVNSAQPVTASGAK